MTPQACGQPVDNYPKTCARIPRAGAPKTTPKTPARQTARAGHAQVAQLPRFTLKTPPKPARAATAQKPATVPPAHLRALPPSLREAQVGAPRAARTPHDR